MGKMKEILIKGDMHFTHGMGKTDQILRSLEEMLYGVTRDNIQRDTRVRKFIKKFHRPEDQDAVHAADTISDLLLMMWNIGIFTETHTDWQNPIIIGHHHVPSHINVKKPKKANRKQEAKRKDVVQPGFRARRGQVTQPTSAFHEGLVNPSGSKKRRSKRHHEPHDGRLKIHKGR